MVNTNKEIKKLNPEDREKKIKEKEKIKKEKKNQQKIEFDNNSNLYK